MHEKFSRKPQEIIKFSQSALCMRCWQKFTSNFTRKILVMLLHKNTLSATKKVNEIPPSPVALVVMLLFASMRSFQCCSWMFRNTKLSAWPLTMRELYVRPERHIRGTVAQQNAFYRSSCCDICLQYRFYFYLYSHLRHTPWMYSTTRGLNVLHRGKRMIKGQLLIDLYWSFF